MSEWLEQREVVDADRHVGFGVVAEYVWVVAAGVVVISAKDRTGAIVEDVLKTLLRQCVLVLILTQACNAQLG